jgi:hypothetical protein
LPFEEEQGYLQIPQAKRQELISLLKDKYNIDIPFNTKHGVYAQTKPYTSPINSPTQSKTKLIIDYLNKITPSRHPVALSMLAGLAVGALLFSQPWWILCASSFAASAFPIVVLKCREYLFDKKLKTVQAAGEGNANKVLSPNEHQAYCDGLHAGYTNIGYIWSYARSRNYLYYSSFGAGMKKTMDQETAKQNNFSVSPR